jgi:hypothetical protein
VVNVHEWSILQSITDGKNTCLNIKNSMLVCTHVSDIQAKKAARLELEKYRSERNN